MTNPFNDNKFFGREKELKKLVINILLKKHTLIIGKKGIGKSTLAQQAISIVNGSIHRIDISPTTIANEFNNLQLALKLKQTQQNKIKILKINTTKTNSTIFNEIIYQLQQNKDLINIQHTPQNDQNKITNLQIKNAHQIIIKSLENKNYIILIDDIDIATPTILNLIHDLITSTTTTIIATSTEIKHERKIKPLYPLFDKIELKELQKETAENLTNYLIQTFLPNLQPEKKQFLKYEIARNAKGNPTIIKSIIAHACSQKHLKDEDIKNLRKLEEKEYINLGPVFSLMLGLFTITKILQIGLENRETYILLSILAFLSYLTIRIFRYFFLFRPQRKK